MIAFDQTKLAVVKLKDVRLNSWNPKDTNTKEYRKIKESIEREGQKVPVVVRENKGLEIIDGCQRWTALNELGAKEIVIYNEGKVSDKDAKNQTLWYQLQVPFNRTMLAPLVLELHKLNLPSPYDDDTIKELGAIEKLELPALLKPAPEPTKENANVRTLSITIAKDKYEFITQAFDAFLAQEQLTEGDYARALELIVADYISGK